MRRAACHIALAAFALSSFGCNGLNFDLDSVPLLGADGGRDVAPDAAGDAMMPLDEGFDQDPDSEGDTSPPDDASLDGGDGADLPDISPTCEIPKPVDPDTCDPTLTGTCPQGGFCNLRAADMMLKLLCSDTPPGTGVRGEACTGTKDCADTFACFRWDIGGPDPRGQECSKFCVLETGFGCETDEFCTSADAVPHVEGYGWCTPRCNPYDATACPVGQTCSVDYNYPAGTCFPEFRCVEVIAFQPAGAECGPGRDVAACERGLSCYQLDAADFRCVRPCEGDFACGDGETCLPPSGPWNLRYCR